MFILVLIVLVLLAVLAVLFTAWSLWFQGYLYTEPTVGLAWRGPAAAGVMTLVVLLWMVVDYRSVTDATAPGRYRPLFEFSATEDQKPFPELRVPRKTGQDKDTEEVYKLRPGGGLPEYRLNGLPSGRPLPDRPPRVIVQEGDERSVFEPERDQEGNFYQRRGSGWSLNRQPEPLRYLDKKGRVMYENQMGQLTTFRTGSFLGNLTLNFLMLAAFFLCWWLLLRFQWPHALLQAFVFWLVFQLIILPPILTRAEEVARQRAVPKASA